MPPYCPLENWTGEYVETREDPEFSKFSSELSASFYCYNYNYNKIYGVIGTNHLCFLHIKISGI